MKIGFIGLGKLGLPCAVAIAMKGHDVMAYDIVPALMNKNPRTYRETGPDGKEPFNPYLERSTIRFGALEEVVAHGDIVFVAVQTPHEPRYEGVARLPSERMDFDYRYLVRSIEEIHARQWSRSILPSCPARCAAMLNRWPARCCACVTTRSSSPWARPCVTSCTRSSCCSALMVQIQQQRWKPSTPPLPTRQFAGCQSTAPS